MTGSDRSLAPKKLPSYLLHKPSGRARVRIEGRDIYLGPYGSEESHILYGQLIGRYASGLPVVAAMTKASGINADDPGPSVAEICLAFWQHAKKHYTKSGQHTSELNCFECCIRVVREMYGLTPAKDFGPLALKAVRAAMVAGDPDAKDNDGEPAPRKPWIRPVVNRMVGRVRQVFKHAIENEMIDASVLTALQTVAPLLKGREHGAADNKKRQAVDQKYIDVVRSKVRPIVKDLIDLQLFTGARSGELLGLTPAMIIREKKEWRAELEDHKCAHHELSRTIVFGPKARKIIQRYLTDDPNQALFKLTRAGYCRAITRACKRAKIERWTPHYLRHTYITRTREKCGIDAAQAVAGHSTSAQTAEYSAKMLLLASKTAAAVG